MIVTRDIWPSLICSPNFYHENPIVGSAGCYKLYSVTIYLSNTKVYFSNICFLSFLVNKLFSYLNTLDMAKTNNREIKRVTEMDIKKKKKKNLSHF